MFPLLLAWRGCWTNSGRIGDWRCQDTHVTSLLCAHLVMSSPWWRHQMETFSALMAICARNSPVSGEFPTQRPVTRSVDVFVDLRLNKRLSKQSWGWWFETLSCPLWRHCNDETFILNMYGCSCHWCQGRAHYCIQMYHPYQPHHHHFIIWQHQSLQLIWGSDTCWFYLRVSDLQVSYRDWTHHKNPRITGNVWRMIRHIGWEVTPSWKKNVVILINIFHGLHRRLPNDNFQRQWRQFRQNDDTPWWYQSICSI